MREMSMMLVALFGMAVLGERVGPARLGGCALMLAGVIALAAS
jgi:multidrug transporter EmrE-like cation transporter